MPTIEQAVESNVARRRDAAEQAPPPRAEMPFLGAPEASTGLPVRGTFPLGIITSTDFYSSVQQFRIGERSSTALPSQAVVKQGTPQSLSNKVLVAPTLGVGGAKLNRYNNVTTTISPASVAANTQATQTFTVPAVQAADKVIGYQWNAAQTKGVTTLAVRVTGAGRIAIDFFNGTAAPLVPTGGLITLFLVQ